MKLITIILFFPIWLAKMAMACIFTILYSIFISIVGMFLSPDEYEKADDDVWETNRKVWSWATFYPFIHL